jgi:uncharacterized protein (TIGR00255 family)
MTGFGAAEGPVAGGRLRIEIRTVNHRFFNFSPKVPGEFSAMEGDIRERVRRDLDRGHVALSARWVEYPEREATLSIDLPRATAAVDRLKELKATLGLAGEVTLELVARQPEVLATRTSELTEFTFADIEPIVAQAAAECRAMRAREGASLGADLRERLAAMEASAAVIAQRAPERLVRERDRLQASVTQLLAGRAMDEQRLALEIAVLADKLDISEELVRFRAHLVGCRTALASDQPAGKQLGFLAQELGREVNTMGSKANDAVIQQQVIAMKGELEKFREQLENLE